MDPVVKNSVAVGIDVNNNFLIKTNELLPNKNNSENQ